MKKLFIFMILLLIFSCFIGISFADYNVEDFHEMDGTIIAKDVHGKTIDYLIDINGTICYLGSNNQPIEEFYVGDDVTMNGTIDYENKEDTSYFDAFDGEYVGKYPTIELNSINDKGNRYGQMRLIDDIDNQYYKQLDGYQL